MFGSQLHIRMIPQFFNFGIAEMSMVPIWVTFPNLPLEYWSAKPLSRIASQVGVPITTDQLTKEKARCSYARVLVHVDASSPLVRSFPVINPDGSVHIQKVVYEFEPRYCSNCQSMTHDIMMCKKNAPKPSTTAPNKSQGGGNNKTFQGPKNKKPMPQPDRTGGTKGRPQEAGTVRANEHVQTLSRQSNNIQRSQKMTQNVLPDSVHGLPKDPNMVSESTSSAARENAEELTQDVPITGLEVVLFEENAGDGFQEVVSRKKRKGGYGTKSPDHRSLPARESSVAMVRRGFEPPSSQ